MCSSARANCRTGGVSKLPHYYFDIETTGLDSEKDQIITIQFQKILFGDGTPEEPLTILKCWEYDGREEKMLNEIAPLIMANNPFKFVPVGNNLNFEFKFLLSKISKHLKIEMDPLYFHSRPHIDLKHVMILLNGGRFKGYNLFLKKIESGINVPCWYHNKDYLRITKYIEMEAEAFTNFYNYVVMQIFSPELGHLILNREESKSLV
jgi:RNase_H superfamily